MFVTGHIQKLRPFIQLKWVSICCILRPFLDSFTGRNQWFYWCKLFISWDKSIIQAVYSASNQDLSEWTFWIFTKIYPLCYQCWKNPCSRSDWNWPGHTAYSSAATRAVSRIELEWYNYLNTYGTMMMKLATLLQIPKYVKQLAFEYK